MEDNKEAVLRRVQKLLAIAGDERADPNEAAAAAKQAEKIMRKYQIEHADVVRRELEGDDNFSTADCTVIMKRDVKGRGAHRPVVVPTWGQWLAVDVAKLFDCGARVSYNPERGAVMRFFGFASDVQVASWTFDYLVGQTIAAIRAFQRTPGAYKRTKEESDSFRRGFVVQLCHMLKAEAAAKAAEMAKAVTSRELMVVKQQAVERRFGEFRYQEKDTKAGSAFAAGVAEGRKVQMRQGVRHDGEGGQLRLEK